MVVPSFACSVAAPSEDRKRMTKDHCPCVVPCGKYAWRGRLLPGEDFLALQGLSRADVQGHGLQNVSPSMQKDMAGNAFSATVCGSVLLTCIVFAEQAM